MNNKFTVSVKDDGVGFDLNEKSSGNGLLNYKRRADKINGNVQIKSELGQGTEIVFEAMLL